MLAIAPAQPVFYPAMGKLTVRFKCIHCGHCCRDVICLPTPWDVIRLARETGADPHKFIEFVSPHEIEEVQKSDPTWLRICGERYMMALRRVSTGCYFLNKKDLRCKGYHARPILCRLYPFALHETRAGKLKSFSLHKDVGCPRSRDDLFRTDHLYELYLEDRKHQEDYADLVQVFNRRRGRGRKPEDFLEMFYTRETP